MYFILFLILTYMKSFKEISKKFYLHEKYDLLTSLTFDYAF